MRGGEGGREGEGGGGRGRARRGREGEGGNGTINFTGMMKFTFICDTVTLHTTYHYTTVSMDYRS